MGLATAGPIARTVADAAAMRGGRAGSCAPIVTPTLSPSGKLCRAIAVTRRKDIE